MYTPFSSRGAFSGLSPPVFSSSGNNWKVTIAHTGHLSPLKLKPALPPTWTVDSEQSPKCTHTAEESTKMVSQESCILGVDTPPTLTPHPRPDSAPARTSHCPRALPVSSSSI